MAVLSRRPKLKQLQSLEDVFATLDETPSLVDTVVGAKAGVQSLRSPSNFDIRQALASVHRQASSSSLSPSGRKDAAPTVPRLLGHTNTLRRVIEHLVRDGKLGDATEPYDRQGNEAYYTNENVARRLGIRYDPTLLRLTRQFWAAVVPSTKDTMDIESYQRLYLRIHKYLIERFDIRDSKAKIQDDWLRDTNNDSSSLDYELFHLSLFELIDLWCDSLDANDYVRLLYAILDGVSHVEHGRIHLRKLRHVRFRDVALAVKRVSTASVHWYLDAMDALRVPAKIESQSRLVTSKHAAVHRRKTTLGAIQVAQRTGRSSLSSNSLRAPTPPGGTNTPNAPARSPSRPASSPPTRARNANDSLYVEPQSRAANSPGTQETVGASAAIERPSTALGAISTSAATPQLDIAGRCAPLNAAKSPRRSTLTDRQPEAIPPLKDALMHRAASRRDSAEAHRARRSHARAERERRRTHHEDIKQAPHYVLDS
ncbi:hypothetical protein SPRG_12018 [Saprolegnia parasitica CBS 223.65]|uniref:Uncharacterized protein n=1 Tax=Saprolegnia parasitica (strain CBS 223.65) TaxID=695850 RepID=A0A067C8L2_SAPPC|nr:hypothetical protein SPRG_12018 [Saprolegnia parasitica CBS 223.65]KDO22881.1 hypothetical protein SPRG_12018 [Saprolegnia parasitica CBS 223.65]|eukprot:XP_012206437.1 hypothetical protein SPRG_12018 [Saprolegnia parasitica CBS 223.65]